MVFYIFIFFMGVRGLAPDEIFFMTVRIFTIRFDSGKELFEDEELAGFMLNKRIKNLHPQFFQQDGVAYWTVFVEYETLLSEPKKRKLLDDLDDSQRLLFQRLREWRKETADKEKIPVFIISKDTQLIDLVKQAPKSLDAYGNISRTPQIAVFGRNYLPGFWGRRRGKFQMTNPKFQISSKSQIPNSKQKPTAKHGIRDKKPAIPFFRGFAAKLRFLCPVKRPQKRARPIGQFGRSISKYGRHVRAW